MLSGEVLGEVFFGSFVGRFFLKKEFGCGVVEDSLLFHVGYWIFSSYDSRTYVLENFVG